MQGATGDAVATAVTGDRSGRTQKCGARREQTTRTRRVAQKGRDDTCPAPQRATAPVRRPQEEAVRLGIWRTAESAARELARQHGGTKRCRPAALARRDTLREQLRQCGGAATKSAAQLDSIMTGATPRDDAMPAPDSYGTVNRVERWRRRPPGRHDGGVTQRTLSARVVSGRGALFTTDTHHTHYRLFPDRRR